MLIQIFKQLWNRRRSNFWIGIELLLVFCLLWYIVDYFFVLQYNKSLTSCRDLNHTWQVDVALLPEEHPEYQPGESDSTALLDNYFRVLDRIRHHKDVEALAVLSGWSTPGGGGYYGDWFRSRRDTTREGNGQAILFDPQTDLFKVFRYTTQDGKPVAVEDFDWSDPKAIVIGDLAVKTFFPDGNILGEVLESPSSPETNFVVKGSIGDIKRFDYERPQLAFYRAERIKADNIAEMEIAVRNRESVPDNRFLQDFKKTMSRELRIGNFYLRGVKSYNRITADTDFTFGQTSNVRIHTGMMLFFLINIMLCVMGTFWYRIRVRREEVGLRMAMGSTRGDIRKILIMEGLSLLAVVVLPAMLIEIQFVYLGLIDTLGQGKKNLEYLPDRTILRFILTNCLTWVLLAVAIVVAIWLPADKAAKLAPADALHYE